VFLLTGCVFPQWESLEECSYGQRHMTQAGAIFWTFFYPNSHLCDGRLGFSEVSRALLVGDDPSGVFEI
jgi:hypothetical protein